MKVIQDEMFGIPFPATGEIVFIGEIPSPNDKTVIEGPFGEYTGYYGGKSRPEPVIQVRSIFHRNDPIILGCPALKPPASGDFFVKPMHAGGIWGHLENTGVPDIQGVWSAMKNGRAIIIISIKQRFPGHSTQAGLAAASYRTGGQQGRFVIIVDDDIDPSNLGDVLWSMGTRCDPSTSINILNGTWAPILDPLLSAEKRAKSDYTGSIAIIDACKPFYWKDEFPEVSRSSETLRRSVLKKWSKLFEEF